MGKEKRVLTCIVGPTVRSIIQQANELEIQKEDIINRIKNNFDGITEKGGCWDYLIKYYEWKDSKNK